jgi:hypothetical protein
LAGIGQLAKPVAGADPPGGGGTTLKALPDDLAGLRLAGGDMAEGVAFAADAAIGHIDQPSRAGSRASSVAVKFIMAGLCGECIANDRFIDRNG